MDAVINLLQSLINVFWSLLDVIVAIVMVILPWLPLLGWVGFWTFAVNWARVFPILWRGGFVGVLLLMLVATLVWGAIAPPPEGQHVLLSLTVSNYAGKFIYVTMLTCIALLCGSAQLSGSFGNMSHFDDESESDDHGHGHSHGHGGHDSHDHGHGHDHGQTVIAAH